MRWNDSKTNHISAQNNMVRLVQSSLESQFIQYDIMLNILGKQLSENDAYLDRKKTRALFAGIMSTDTNIAGFGLSDVDGNLITIYPKNIEDVTIPSLLVQEHTAQSFKKSMQSKHIIIGRNYYNKELESWVVPFRKAIRNPQNEVISVMTFGLYLSAFSKQLSDKITLTDNRRLTLLRNDDLFHQLLLSSEKEDIEQYKAPVPLVFYEKLMKNIINKHGVTIQAVKESGMAYSGDSLDTHGDSILYSVMYDKKCSLWVIADTHFSTIFAAYFRSVSAVLLLYFVGLIIVFYIFRLIANREEEKAKIRDHESKHDPLTGLRNRNYFNRFMSKSAFEIKRFAILQISLNNFRKVNNVFGYSIGDRVLAEVADRLRAINKDYIDIIRYGDDVFLITVDYINYNRILKYAKKIREVLASNYLVSGYKVSIDCRVGVTRFPLDSKIGKELLRNVEFAAEHAKSLDNQIAIYQPSLHDAHHQHFKIENSLSSAIKNCEITLAYQPQFNANGQIVGVESLARWHSPELGFVSPQDFIQIAEKTNLIFDLGAYLIDRAVRDFSSISFSNDSVTLSINVSVKQFMQNNFAEIVNSVLTRYSFPPERVIIEVTETLFINSLEIVNESLKELKGIGMSISLDDFGTGYSSLSILKSLPIDEIKIDKTFVDDIVEDEKSLKMLESIISISSDLGFTVVAEGVEKESQRELLRTIGTDIYQGYLFAKPMNLEDLQKFIEQMARLIR